MNLIEIRYSILSPKAELKINGEKASPYSELSSLLCRPFLDSCFNLLKELDNEIFDEYEIELYASRFQYEIILALAKSAKYCRDVHFHDVETLFSRDETLNRLAVLGEKYGITIESKTKVNVYDQCNDNTNNIEFIENTEQARAEIGIYNNAPAAIPQTIRTAIIISDEIDIEYIADRMCYLLPQSQLGAFWDYCRIEFIEIPAITEYLTALRYAKLNDIDKFELKAIRDNKTTYYIGSIPATMDAGEQYTIDFACFPAQAYHLKSENPAIVSVNNNDLSALSQGVCNLVVLNEKGDVLESRTISVIYHQYAESITVVPQFKYLKRYERNRIDVIITPLNSEDANKLLWSASDPSVVQVDERGNVVGLKEGRVTIQVSGHKTSSSATIEVKPSIQKLRIRQQSIRLKNNETAIIDCELAPPDAPTDNLTWELDNKNIAAINVSKTGLRCQVTAGAAYEGKGNIRCFDSASKLSSICNIEVISSAIRVKQSGVGIAALWCWLLGIASPFLLPISAICSFYGLSKDPEPQHHRRYVICATGSIITLLIWIIAMIRGFMIGSF